MTKDKGKAKMTEERFNALYKGFSRDWPIPTKENLEGFKKAWGSYKKKMAKGELPLVENDDISWSKSNENDDKYLLTFIEKVFGLGISACKILNIVWFIGIMTNILKGITMDILIKMEKKSATKKKIMKQKTIIQIKFVHCCKE